MHKIAILGQLQVDVIIAAVFKGNGLYGKLIALFQLQGSVPVVIALLSIMIREDFSIDALLSRALLSVDLSKKVALLGFGSLWSL